jgi:hypothetical protein
VDTWCDEHLPEIYDHGMFDYEEIAEEVWEAVTQTAQETVLAFLEDEDDRDRMMDQITEAAHAWFEGHHQAVLDSLPTVDAGILEVLLRKPQEKQHTPEWYAQRRNRLTASEFKMILDGRREWLKRQKVDPAAAPTERPAKAPVAIAQEDGEMNATSWGHRFEPIVRKIYELEIAGVDTVCDTLGRFTHRAVPWLSASPDGIVLRGPLAGRLVEIKAPKTRKPGTWVPDDYWVQMQIQLEVADMEAVDFLEAQFSQRPIAALTGADRRVIAKSAWKGRIAVYGWLENPETWVYSYSEPVEDLDDANLPLPPDPSLPLLESSVWWLRGWYPRTVLRNRIWWDTIGWPAAELFWTEVDSARLALGTAAASDTIEHIGSGWIGTG